MGRSRKLAVAAGVPLVLGLGFFVLLPSPQAIVRNGQCGGFELDTGETKPGAWGDRSRVGSLAELPPQGLGEIDGEVRGDTFYGPDGLEVDVHWEPHDGYECSITE